MQELTVELGERSYPIYIGEGLLGQPELLLRHITAGQVMVVTNDTIAPLYLDAVLSACEHLQVDQCILPDGESHKNLQTLNRIFDALLARPHSRTTMLIALGGGVVGDMTGFAAACYQRGVDFLQVPTTLLAQVDSSVGGKTGVNHRSGKNMIGAFHQPRCVIADTRTLDTLPDREYAAGLAEVIKYGLIWDAGFFEWIEANIDALMARRQDVLAHAIWRSCSIKARVVGEDERESGLRAILNFGHTFGHAIETHQAYGQWLHGEAVAAGMVVACELSARLGKVDSGLPLRLVTLQRRLGLAVAPPADLGGRRFLVLMAVDKKAVDGRLRLVLLAELGAAVVVTDTSVTEILKAIEASRRFAD